MCFINKGVLTNFECVRDQKMDFEKRTREEKRHDGRGEVVGVGGGILKFCFAI